MTTESDTATVAAATAVTTLTLLRRARGTVRGHLTQMKAKLQAAFNDKNKSEAAIQLQRLNTRKTKLSDLNQQILAVMTDPVQIEQEMNDLELIDDFIDEWTVKMNEIIAGQSDPVNVNSDQNSDRGINRSPSLDNSLHSNMSELSIRLPKIELQKFNGNVQKWQAFWSSFSSVVHERQNLCAVDKLNYLRSMVTDQALKCIDGLEITDDNYVIAVDRLKQRFGRPELIINGIMTALNRLTAPKNETVSLRKFLDEIEVKVLNLKTLNVDVNACGDLLISNVVTLLPRNLQLEWIRKSDGIDRPGLDKLIEFLRKEVELRERLPPELTKQETSVKPPKKEGNANASTAALNITANAPSDNGTKPKRKMRCMICESEDHFTLSCTITPVSARIAKVKELKKCDNCLWRNHPTSECKKDPAKCRYCSDSHHSALCPQLDNGDSAQGERKQQSNSSNVSVSHVQNDSCSASVLLKSAVVIVNGRKAQIKARLIVDDGSQTSFISKRLAEKVGAVQVGVEKMSVRAFEQSSTTEKEYRKLRVQLTGHSGNNNVELILREAEAVCSHYSLVPSKWVQTELKKRGMAMADPCDNDSNVSDVDIIIGSDLYWTVVTGRVVRLSDTLVAAETIFGWMANGPEEARQRNVSCNVVNVMHTFVDTSSTVVNSDDELNQSVERFWNIESLGIAENEKCSEIDSVEQKTYDTIEKVNDRYRVRLPWNERKNELRSNHGEALKRFHLLVRKFSKEEQKIVRYHQTMCEYMNNDHAEKVTDTSTVGDVVYYIPHQAVFRQNHDTMKLRIVFDASSGRPSLNDCLYAGPHLNPDVLDLLLRFRQFAVAITADMEKAFLQVEVHPDDRDAARFIWMDVNWKPGDPILPKTYRMKRVLFGLNCGPFLLAATLKYHLRLEETVEPEVTSAIENNTYVDDLIKSVATFMQGWRLYVEGKRLLKEAGFNLRKWATNSKELREAISKSESEGENNEFSEKSKEETIKVLGMVWNQQKDILTFDVSELAEFLIEQQPTKRTVLRAMARIFDPIGLVSPFTVRLKILFQRLWKENLPWDEPIPVEFATVWNEWMGELKFLQLCEITRCVSNGVEEETPSQQLHAFCDASEKAYGAAVYLVEDGRTGKTSRLIASRNKVASLKRMTIPRLELMGALVCARLVRTVKRAMNLQDVQVTYWTDSMVAMYWIRGDTSRWKTFVANRVREIKELTTGSDWQHVRTEFNPADKLTRGLSADVLAEDQQWWSGPVWLVTNERYSSNCEDTELPSEIDKEEKKENTVMSVTISHKTMWEANRFSRLTKLIRTIAWVKRFIHNCRAQVKERGELSSTELNSAEQLMLKEEQRAMFETEYNTLKENEPISKKSKLHRLDPQFGEDELIRLGGRLHFSMLDHSVRHPILIDGDTWIGQLIIRNAHSDVMHGGVQETLVELREKYWIPAARSKVKKVLRRCVVCAKRCAKPATMIEAPLPSDRLERTNPFEIVGMDYAGPIYVKEGKNQRKTYVLLITCAVTRAVHLELTATMTTDDFLLAFRRFLARRGLCHTIWSDNAKTFKRAEIDLNVWSKLVEFASEKRIKWKFIADRAPWWGGMWERMVRSIKEKLKTVCGRAMLNFEELRTVLTEVESIVNSRPLCYVSEDPKEVLTPSHFLTGRRSGVIPFPSTQVEKLGGSFEAGKRWKHRVVTMNRFWKSWRQDYLLNLRTVHERREVGREKELKAGQLVLLDDERTVKHLWKTCIVKETIAGRDGKIRSCMIKMPGDKVIKRPIQLLYPLELCE